MKLKRAAAPATKGIRIRWASLYDAMNRAHFLGREQRFREWTVDLAAITPGQAVLDVGCGTGNLTMAAAQRAGPEAEVHGIDAAPEMIRRAERKAAEHEIAARFQVGLIEDLPFPDGVFDVVLSSLMLHHLPPKLKRLGVAEIARVLAPGGRLVAVDIDPPLMGNLRIVSEALEASGFTGIQRGRTPYRVLFLPIHHLSATSGAA
jgi:ubiquinone/menaquinone biosynthesis C-methylase UbiE